MMIDFIVLTEIGSDTHMTSTLGVRGRRVQGKNEILLDVGGWGVRECSRRIIEYSLLLTRNLPFDFEVRQ